jgi:hypothetical protein
LRNSQALLNALTASPPHSFPPYYIPLVYYMTRMFL